MPPIVIYVVIIIVVLVVLLMGIAVVIAKFYRKVDQGKVLIINKMKAEPEVTFTGGTVIPVIHRAEVMDISVKAIELERRGAEGLICRDNIRADIRVNFFVRVNMTKEDVLKVAQAIGCARASDQQTLEDLFIPKFSEALKTVGKRLDFEQLYTQRDIFKDQIIEVIGTDLNGYALEDAAIDYLEQTPLSSMDPNNILDAQGIRKITEMTTEQNVHTNRLKQTERKQIGKEDLDADIAVFEFSRQKAEAEALRDKDITMAQIRAENDALRLKHQETKDTRLKQQEAEEEVAIREQVKARAIEVAQKNREKDVTVEGVRVLKARDLEEIGREREVELKRIDKELKLEVERKAIADVIRERIAVEKGVAVEEEHIKDLRLIKETERQKNARLITAEGIAEEQNIKQKKAAEAAAEVAKSRAEELITSSTAELEASEKRAQAKIRMAAGVQAEDAAKGLAQIKVKEANAIAMEKEGMVKARITREQMLAEAEGEEKKGLALIKIRSEKVSVVEREGQVNAQITREQMLAEAEGEEKKGLAGAKVREAEAAALQREGDAKATSFERMGQAEASAIQQKLAAEASGLAQKAEAMKALDGVGREHEEFRLTLEKEKAVELETIRVRAKIASAQAEVMSKAFGNAKINIVGGDGAFFDKFTQAATLGQSLDSFVDNSSTAKTLMSDYLSGESSLTKDVKDILTRPALSSDSLQNLTVSAVLGKMMLGANPKEKSKLRALMNKARELGVDGLGSDKKS